MASEDALDLLFTSEARVGGQVIHGEVMLNLPLLQLYKFEEVHVNLRGKALTKIGSHQEEIHLIQSSIGIWKKSAGSEASSPANNDDHIVHKPFQFTLPLSHVPSGKYGQEGRRCTWPANMEYCVQVVGVNVDPKKNRKLRRPFAYLPAHRRGSELSEMMNNGWTDGWRTFEGVKPLRRGLPWRAGSYDEVTVSLSLPDVEVFPVQTSIPFKLDLTTSVATKSQPSAQTSRLLGVDFTIARDVHFKAHSKEKTIQKELVARLGSFGILGEKYPETRMQAEETPWFPIYDDDKQPTGSWKQEYHIASTFSLGCSPSVQSKTLNVMYFAQLRVTSSGMGPDTVITIPLEVVSNRY